MSRLIRTFPAMWCGLLLLAGCQRTVDMSLDNVFVADRTAIPGYAERLSIPNFQPIGLGIEVSAQYVFPSVTYVLDGFCGEELRIATLAGGQLYRPRRHDPLTDQELQAVIHGDGLRHTYFAFADIHSMRLDPRMNAKDFDLTTDTRDICLKVFGREINNGRELGSNEIRIPRDTIDRALRAGVKPLPLLE